MKNGIWTAGVLSGLIATLGLMAVSFPLFLLHVIPLTVTEYAARFILEIPNIPMQLSFWAIGVMTNLVLGSLFGLCTVCLFRLTGFEEIPAKILSIAGAIWFFHLVIVPFLDPGVSKYSQFETALAYLLLYILWTIIATYFIVKVFRVPELKK